jgi:hypothetical protein
MLKTVSSVANALGALNYKGTWNATTNTPTLASGVGTQGDYYVVSVAGATDLDGITNWGVGDWAAFNGSVWQRVEGGADGNFVNLEITGTSELTGNVGIGKSSGSNALEVQGESLFGSGTDGIKLTYSGGSSTGIIDTGYTSTGLEFRVGNVKKLTLNSSGNLEMNSGSGIDFSATAGTGTSELLDDYEEGAFSPTLENVTITYDSQSGTYTKIGRDVFCYGFINVATIDNADSSSVAIGGLPFTPSGVACALSLSNGQSATPLFGSKLTDTTGAIVSGGNILPSNVASQYITAYNVANVIANTGGSFYFALHYTT